MPNPMLDGVIGPADGGGDAAWAARAERLRLDAVAEEVARAGPLLDDRRRAAIARLLDQLLQTIEDELRQQLVERLRARWPVAAASLESAALGLVRTLLIRAGMLADQDLVAAALRRTDEHILAGTDRPDGSRALLDELVAHGDPAVAAAAMAVLIGEGRRLDGFREPALARSDLPAELQHRLVWRTAAALRTALVSSHGVEPARADTLVGEAAQAALAGYDEDDRLEARASALAQALAAAGQLDDRMIVALFRAGHPAAAVAGLALRASVPFAAAWDRLLSPEIGEVARLLAAAALDRQGAADLMLALHGADRLADGIARFEAVAPGEAWAALGLWRMDETYRRAVVDLIDRRRRG